MSLPTVSWISPTSSSSSAFARCSFSSLCASLRREDGLDKVTRKYQYINGKSTSPITPELSEILTSAGKSTEEIVCLNCECEALNYALSKLEPNELRLIKDIYFKKMTLTNYAKEKGISYCWASVRKRMILNKLFMNINIYNNNFYK